LSLNKIFVYIYGKIILPHQKYPMTNKQQSERDFRIFKLKKIKLLGINPYPAKFNKKDHITDIIRNYESKNFRDIEEIISNPKNQVSTAGRIILHRSHGKILFIKIQDQDNEIQLMLHKENCQIINNEQWSVNSLKNEQWEETSAYKFAEKLIDMWDFIGIKGEIFKTHKWELTIFVSEFQLLTKALRPLPDKHSWLADMDTRLRKRYLDTIVNKDVKEMLMRRTQFRQAMRDFLISKWFVEVHTPVLETTTGGADANPFETHHKAFDMPIFLRISAGELRQKRLMVGGFEKTFEIARIFRNEWVSPEHAQDYMQMENYRAYADYHDQMQLIKEMYIYIVDTVYNKRIFKIRGFNVDFNDERKEYDFTKTIQDMTWIDIRKATDKNIKDKLDEFKIEYPDENRQRLVDYLRKRCRKQISWPGFLINEPKFMSPLAKSVPKNEKLTQRFHILIAGSELWNGYSELNDPIDQAERFQEQQGLRDAGDEEAQMADRDFVEALEHGMPPVTWFGISERLLAFLEDKPIREIAFFPLMKPEDTENNISTKANTTIEGKKLFGQDTITNKNKQNIKLDTIQPAEELSQKYLTDTYNHCKQVANIMKFFAKKLWQNENYRYVTGLLHDVDWDYIWKNGDKHLWEDFDKITNEIDLPTQMKTDIKSHAHFLTWVQPETLAAKYLCAIDELSWLIHAYSLMRPTGMEWMKAKSIKKKIKDKKFAAGVNREEIKNCEKLLNIQLDEFIEQVIEAIQNNKQ